MAFSRLKISYIPYSYMLRKGQGWFPNIFWSALRGFSQGHVSNVPMGRAGQEACFPTLNARLILECSLCGSCKVGWFSNVPGRASRKKVSVIEAFGRCLRTFLIVLAAELLAAAIHDTLLRRRPKGRQKQKRQKKGRANQKSWTL